MSWPVSSPVLVFVRGELTNNQITVGIFGITCFSRVFGALQLFITSKHHPLLCSTLVAGQDGGSCTWRGAGRYAPAVTMLFRVGHTTISPQNTGFIGFDLAEIQPRLDEFEDYGDISDRINWVTGNLYASPFHHPPLFL